LSEFFEEAESKPWFNNTLFVVLGDHGQRFYPKYQMPLNYHHIPVLMYHSKMDSARVNRNYFLQMDVGPTVMEYLKLPYKNNTLGVDVNSEQRPFAFFSADDKIGVLDSAHYLIVKGEYAELYQYSSGSTLNEYEHHSKKIEAMKTYAYSMVRTSQYLIDNKQTE
jgi:phosphoglycerol transferase MdoB-like AlkP superfamily enzyme